MLARFYKWSFTISGFATRYDLLYDRFVTLIG
jgi:hypothetical protein